MELLILACVFSWCLRHWWDGRKNDYRSKGNDYRNRVRGASQRHAGQRYATGWGLFQLRHGWGPMVKDVRDGWGDAKTATDKWRNGEGERPGFAEAWRTGWRGGAIPDPRQDQPAVDRPRPTDPAPAPAVPPPTIVVINNPPNGGTVTTPTMTATEVNSLDAYRRLLQESLADANTRMEAASQELHAAERQIALYDGAHSSLAAHGLGSQTTGGMAELMESAQGRRRRAADAQTAAERDAATSRELLAAVARTGQDAVQETISGASEVAKTTDYYQPQ